MDGKVMDSAMEAAARAVYGAMGDEINGSEDIARAAITTYLAAKEAEGFAFVNLRKIGITDGPPLCLAARPREEDR